MLTADLAKPVLRKGELRVRKLPPKERERLLPMAQSVLDVTRSCEGQTQGEWKAALDGLVFAAKDKWIVDGFRKLVLDACVFDEESAFVPADVREALFLESARRRRDQVGRDVIIDEVWRAQFANVGPKDAFEASLYADLKDALVLQESPQFEDSELVELWHFNQAQAVMLRAERAEVEIVPHDAQAMRKLLQFMKFQRLLFEATPTDESHHTWKLVVDGPMSMFQQTSKYGLRLAMLLKALEKTGPATLEAPVKWGKAKKTCTFFWETSGGVADWGHDVVDEVEKLHEVFVDGEAGWRSTLSTDLLLGQGLTVVPDLTFTHDDGRVVHLEVLGFWSRTAVVRRVDWAEAHPQHHVVFAYSDKLRVSEKMLETTSSALLPFKGVLRKKAVVEALEKVLTSSS